jgi:hypothetical protein
MIQYTDKKSEGEGSDSEEEDNSTSLLSVSACNNTLNLVMRDEGVMRYVLSATCACLCFIFALAADNHRTASLQILRLCGVRSDLTPQTVI